MQMDGANMPRRSMFAVARSLVSSGGYSRLWSGLGASLQRQLVYGQLRIGVYNSIVDSNVFDTQNIRSKLFVGALAGVSSAALANPLDLIIVRTQAESSLPSTKQRYNRGAFRSIATVYRELGLLGMFSRGVGPTMSRAAIVTACEQGTYDFLKHALMRDFGFRDALPVHLTSSFVAGLSASIVSCPIDVVKTHVMASSGRESVSSWVVARKLLRRPASLYRGFVPYYFKVGPWAMVMFVAFEQYKRLYILGSEATRGALF
eukprot:g4490.t1